MGKLLAASTACGVIIGFLAGVDAGDRHGHHDAISEFAKECGTKGQVDAGITRIECRVKRHPWDSDDSEGVE